MPGNPNRNYIVAAGLALMALAALSIALCIYADPYRMYATARIADKPTIYRQAALAKSYMIEHLRPTTLVLGNAQVESGLDPESQDWPESLRPVFNAAGANVDIFMAWRLMQHDIAVKPPQLVVLSLDFLDFVDPEANANSVPQRNGEARLLITRNGTPNPTRTIQLWKDFIATTLKRQAIIDSISTLSDRGMSSEATMTRFGFNPARDYESLLHRSGAEAVFSHNDAIYRAQYRASVNSYFYDPSRNLQFRSLAAIITLAEQNDIRLILFIPPYHSRYLEILHETGFWPSFEAWKGALVRAVDEAAGKRRDLVLLYDFSDYDDVSGEHVPQPGDTQAEMRWYRDSTHYTSALGDLMIASMMGAGPVLGDELNNDNLQADIERVRRDRDRLFAPPAFETAAAHSPSRH